MKQLARRILAAVLVFALTGMAGAFVFWIVATTQGARWVLTSASPLAGISFTAQTIEGTVGNHLLLTQVRLGLAQQKLELDRVELRWKPLLLLTGTLAIKELSINGFRIQDNAPPDTYPPKLAWPKIPLTARRFDGTISHLRLTDISYRRLQEPALLVQSITGSVAWQDSRLSLQEFRVVAPDGGLAGNFLADFAKPSLTADLEITPAQPVGEMDRFSVLLRPRKGTKQEIVAVGVTLGGIAGTRKLLELSGDIGMTKDAFSLHRLRLLRPGQKGLVTADGNFALSEKGSVLTLQMKVAGLDLTPDLNLSTDLYGTLAFSGTVDSYRGTITLSNQAKGWQTATVSSAYRGTREGVQLAPITGSMLDGSLAGRLSLDWRKGFVLLAEVKGRNFNPARIAPDWKGVVNFNASSTLAWSGKTPLTGSIRGTLLESSLHGQALTGELQAELSNNSVFFSSLALQGKGFDLHASGALDKRLRLTAKISDFSRLVPGSAGALQTAGWLHLRDSQLGGRLVGTASKLAYSGVQIGTARLSARAEQGRGGAMRVTADLLELTYNKYMLRSVTVALDGTVPAHTLNATLRSSQSEVQLNLAAGYRNGVWKGELARLIGRDTIGPWNLMAPAGFAISSGKITLSPLILVAATGERIEASADLALHPLSGLVRTQWTGLNLARANPWLKDVKLAGNSRGTVNTVFLAGNRVTLKGSVSGSGSLTSQGQRVTIQLGLLSFDGNEQGLQVALELGMADGASLKASFLSAAPFRLVVPEQGELTAEASGIDLALLKPWLPPEMLIAGRLSGRAKGSMSPGQRFKLDGNALLTGGTLQQQGTEGALKFSFTAAKGIWSWHGDALEGSIALTMAEHGQVRATFRLPVAARLPVAVNPKGALRVSIRGQLQEKGILTALFPGLIQESYGTLDVDLKTSGTWQTPHNEGTVRISKTGAYLPTAGIHLKDVQLAAYLTKDSIHINAFRATSGPGHIEGTALLTLDGWHITKYQGTITGANFQTIHFPELHLLSSPRLSFEGTPRKLTLQGELRLPELNIIEGQSPDVLAPSSDVIREGRDRPVAKDSPLALDVQLRVLLGEKVFVKVSGIDARLGGAIDLSFSNLDSIASKGEIRVVKGRYRTYGVNLDIVRGRLFFAGGPVTSPSLDFLALRTIGDVRAGVTVVGNLRKPVIKLYSEPPMPDMDILAYIVLGHPLGSSGEQASLVAQAAEALLTSGQAAVLQEQLKNKLGLSTLEIQSGVGKSAGAMGYKPLQVTSSGAVPAAQQSAVTETVLTVGTYLSPQLYLSYGKSLFTGGNLFRLRYDIHKRWQIETQTGSNASGADLYYKLEFR